MNDLGIEEVVSANKGDVKEWSRVMKDIPPGEIVHVEVRHDDDCGIFEDRPCDCEPETESGARVERKYGGGA